MAWQVEAKILVGESVDISVLQTQLEERYRAMAANESDQPQQHHHHQPQLPDLKPALPVEVCLCAQWLATAVSCHSGALSLSLSLSLNNTPGMYVRITYTGVADVHTHM